MERKRLAPDEIAEKLADLKGWSVEGDHIVKHFKFADFAGSLDFVNRVGAVAEAADHHPDITFGWGYASVSTTTHDRGGVTDVDLDLAEKVDQLLEM